MAANNTTSYLNAISAQADSAAKDYAAALKQAAATASGNLTAGTRSAAAGYDALQQANQHDALDRTAARQQLLRANGSRLGLGESLYGTSDLLQGSTAADIAYGRADTLRSLGTASSGLQETAESLAAQGTAGVNQSAAALQQQDARRTDENLRAQYECEAQTAADTASRQADREDEDLTYLRELALACLEKGIMPTEAMLTALGLTAEDAQQYTSWLWSYYRA